MPDYIRRPVQFLTTILHKKLARQTDANPSEPMKLLRGAHTGRYSKLWAVFPPAVHLITRIETSSMQQKLRFYTGTPIYGNEPRCPHRGFSQQVDKYGANMVNWGVPPLIV